MSAQGVFQSKRGGGLIHFLLWQFIKIPVQPIDSAFTLSIKRGVKSDIWIRSFGSKVFTTKVKSSYNTIFESRGPFAFEFELIASDEKLIYSFKKFKLFGVTMPSFLSVKPRAVGEKISLTKWAFEVETLSPWGSLIIKYWGIAEVKALR